MVQFKLVFTASRTDGVSCDSARGYVYSDLSEAFPFEYSVHHLSRRPSSCLLDDSLHLNLQSPGLSERSKYLHVAESLAVNTWNTHSPALGICLSEMATGLKDNQDKFLGQGYLSSLIERTQYRGELLIGLRVGTSQAIYIRLGFNSVLV
jgi:hypothetical protein